MRSGCQFKISSKVAKACMLLFKPWSKLSPGMVCINSLTCPMHSGQGGQRLWRIFFYSTKSRHSPTALHLIHEYLLVSIDTDKHLVAHLVREIASQIVLKRKQSFQVFQHTDPTTLRLMCSTETSGFFSGASDIMMCVVGVSCVRRKCGLSGLLDT